MFVDHILATDKHTNNTFSSTTEYSRPPVVVLTIRRSIIHVALMSAEYLLMPSLYGN